MLHPQQDVPLLVQRTTLQSLPRDLRRFRLFCHATAFQPVDGRTRGWDAGTCP
jgi:hypothetical protein